MLKTSLHGDFCLFARFAKRYANLSVQTRGKFGWSFYVDGSCSSNARFAILEQRGESEPIKLSFLYVQTKESRKIAFYKALKYLQFSLSQ